MGGIVLGAAGAGAAAASPCADWTDGSAGTPLLMAVCPATWNTKADCVGGSFSSTCASSWRLICLEE
ncbi:MAG: hypothetical protein R2939_02820 [Kofleriaceae bacterium]